MKTSTEIISSSKIVGEERAIELISKAGFDAWDFSMSPMYIYDYAGGVITPSAHPLGQNEYIKFAKKLKNVSDGCAMVCNQSHAPYRGFVKDIEDYIKRAIECTAIVGAEYCIVHPEKTASVQENACFFQRLIEFSKGYGVKIATENMWIWNDEADRAGHAACSSPESFNSLLDEVDDEFLVACLDIGHAEMMGDETNAPEMIRALGNRLKTLHVHDNDKWRDSHQIPFSMNIDFEPVIKALKDVNYDGYITLEADSYLGAYDESNVSDGIRKLSESARKLADMYENM